MIAREQYRAALDGPKLRAMSELESSDTFDFALIAKNSEISVECDASQRDNNVHLSQRRDLTFQVRSAASQFLR
jgi:hypothetical protein